MERIAAIIITMSFFYSGCGMMLHYWIIRLEDRIAALEAREGK
jgi:hypothetical protein